MITSTQTQIALMRDLTDKLNVRLANNAGLNSIRSAFDANSQPEIFISHGGNEAEGQPVVYVRIMQISAVSADIFGNALLAYTPHKMQIAYEIKSTNDSWPAHADLFTVEYEALKLGVKLELIEIASGTAVTETSVNAATPIASLDDLYWPTKGV